MKPRFHINHPKRLIIIALTTLVVLAVATYSIMSILEWNSLQKRSGEASTALKAKIDSSLGSEKATGTNSVLIKAVISDFDKKNGVNPCSVSSLYRWQTAIQAAKKVQTTCEDNLAGAKTVIASMKPLTKFLDEQETIVEPLNSAIYKTREPKDYALCATIWGDLSKTLSDSSVDSDFKPVRTSIISSADLISTAYTHLDQANKDENKTAFNTALEELAKAYATLVTVSASEKVEYTRLVTVFTAAYDTLAV